MPAETLNELRDRAYPQGDAEAPPSMGELKAKALFFVRNCRPKEYRQLKKAGELERYCLAKANRAKQYAQSLIRTGELEMLAWNQAIRQEILESESD